MWRIRHYFWQAFLPACLLATVGFIWNATSDVNDVVAAAKQAGCGAAPCRLARTDRGPVVQTVTFANPNEAEIVMDCERELYLVGGWACAKRR